LYKDKHYLEFRKGLILFNIESLVLKAKSKFNGFAGTGGELFWSTGGIEIPNHKD